MALKLTESLFLLQLYLAFLSTSHGLVLSIRNCRRICLSDKKYYTIYIYLFLTHLFAVSALLRAVFFLASIFSTFGFDHFPKKRQQILISESNKLNKSNV